MAEMTAEERAEHIKALGPLTYKDKTLWFRSDRVLECIRQAVEQEREECAKVADEGRARWRMSSGSDTWMSLRAKDIAAAIRARGEKGE